MSVETRLDVIIALLVALTAANAVALWSTWTSIVARAMPTVGRIWGWLMKRKHLRDRTWPVRPIVRDVGYRWKLEAPFIRVWVEFVVEPQIVPVEIQATRLRCDTDWGRIEDIDEWTYDDDYAPLSGRTLQHKGQTAPYTAVFEIVAPEDRAIAVFKPTLIVEAEGLPCFAEIDEIRLPNPHPE